ncbi:MAG: purine-nucleoside phosphorylase [Salinibacter sp.]
MSDADASALTPEGTRAYRRHVEAAAAAFREQAPRLPSRAIVLAPQIRGLGDAFSAQATWTAGDLPHLPGTDEGLTLAVGALDATPVVVLEGALSLADGYTPREVVFPVRVLAEAGVDTMLFADTGESLTAEMAPADLALITDHINFQGANPLAGPNVDAWGPRFPDMSEPYAPAVRRRAEAAAAQEGIPLRQGVYVAVVGPNRPTRAEARMARSLGGDLVGTRTVPEVIAARHMDLRVGALSVVTRRRLVGDAEAPDAPSSALADARPRLRTLLADTLARLASEDPPT